MALEDFSDLVAEAGPSPSQSREAEEGGKPIPSSAPAREIRQTFKRLKGKNYYQIFDLEPGTFSAERLKAHYFRFTGKFGPDLMMQVSGVDAAMAEDLLAMVATAFNTLSDPVKKGRYDELLKGSRGKPSPMEDDHLQAQVQAQSGKIFIEKEEWDNAERALQEACNLEPGNGDYLAHLAWAIYRNPRSTESRAVQEKARQLLNSALSLELTPQGFAFKGWMLLEAGQHHPAEAEFSKALKLDAHHPMARQGMRLLQKRREQQKKGLFRRMFG
jgi:tetratricopeptide (TPR) repeat protein